MLLTVGWIGELTPTNDTVGNICTCLENPLDLVDKLVFKSLQTTLENALKMLSLMFHS